LAQCELGIKQLVAKVHRHIGEGYNEEDFLGSSFVGSAAIHGVK
jgi:hypothetical protein